MVGARPERPAPPLTTSPPVPRRCVLRARCDHFRARCDSGMRDAGDAELRVPEHFSEARACAGRLHAWRACVAQVAI